MDLQNESLVSIIIPTKNSSQTISTCLKSICNQTYSNIEIIVIDNHSNDDTCKKVKEFSATLFVSNSERAKAKNFAMSKGNGKYVCFIDSDMELTKTVIEECVKVAEKLGKSIGGIIIPERSVGRGYWVKVRDFERSLYFGTDIESARFFERKLAIQAGGFDEKIIFFEESTLPQKLALKGFNTKIRINSLIYHHEPCFSFVGWLRKKYYYAKTLGEYKARYSKNAENQVSPIYRIRVFIKNGRWKLLTKIHLSFGIIILKFCEMIAISLARI